VKDQHRIGHSPVRVAHRFAERLVMHAQLGKRLARFEMKIPQRVVAFLRRELAHRRLHRLGVTWDRDQK
jgi:hypothetical protein